MAYNAILKCTKGASGIYADVIVNVINGYIYLGDKLYIDKYFNDIEEINEVLRSKFVELDSNEVLKRNLQIGNLVILRNGRICLVQKVQKGMYVFISEKESYHWLNDYSENLKSKQNSGLDVMQVYGLPLVATDTLKFLAEGRAKIWERDEKVYREMSVEDIKNELGIIVKG